MSYTPTTWKAGDKVTSAKLNKMEQGIANSNGSGGSIEIIEMTNSEDSFVLGKTAKEIADLMKSGKLVFARCYQEDVNFDSCIDLHIGSMLKDKNSLLWNFTASSPNESSTIVEFVAVTDNDYPTTDFMPGGDDSGEVGGGIK